MTQIQKHKEVWTVRSEWSTENNGDIYEVKDLIVFDKNQVEQYLKEHWNLENSDDLSDDQYLCFSYSGIYDELGNEVKFNESMLDENNELIDGYYEQTDTISAYKDYTIVNDTQIQELKDIFMGHVVIDLTED